jgi:response regulator RpfG family c-di-GMP phosphodiesterase
LSDNSGHHDLIDAVFAVLSVGSGDSVEQSQDVPWILCIDDDADFTDALRIRLEEHGVAVVRAFNGMEGYRMAFTSPASAILLDFNMPNGQGDYVLNRLKDNPVTKDIPVVVISGAKDKMLQRRMLAMGATAFLEKPVNFESLRSHLANYLDILDGRRAPTRSPRA